jgi:hypothetical protein
MIRLSLSVSREILHSIRIPLTQHELRRKEFRHLQLDPKSLSEHPISTINNQRPLRHFTSYLLEHCVCEILIDIIIPMLFTLKLNNERMRYTSIVSNQQNHSLLNNSQAGENHTCIPSGELSIPSDMDLMYAVLVVGCIQLSFSASKLLKTAIACYYYYTSL